MKSFTIRSCNVLLLIRVERAVKEDHNDFGWLAGETITRRLTTTHGSEQYWNQYRKSVEGSNNQAQCTAVKQEPEAHIILYFSLNHFCFLFFVIIILVNERRFLAVVCSFQHRCTLSKSAECRLLSIQIVDFGFRTNRNLCKYSFLFIKSDLPGKKKVEFKQIQIYEWHTALQNIIIAAIFMNGMWTRCMPEWMDGTVHRCEQRPNTE